MIRSILYSLGLILLFHLESQGGVVVNEVLANEPGGQTTLEWFELYNDAATTASLDFYVFDIYSLEDTVGSTLSGSLGPYGYMVVCRNAVRFEETWGDGSGTWGDAASENYSLYEAAMELENGSGGVALSRLGNLVSVLTWTESGRDGYSWERVDPKADPVEQSVAVQGSTPGGINSVTVMPYDLALEGASVTAQDGLTTVVFTLVNRGRTTISNDTLRLYYHDDGAPDEIGELIASESVGTIDSGVTVYLVGQYRLPGVYCELIAVLDNDDRVANNRRDFMAVGEDYPPVVLSEFQAMPRGTLNSEWVELKNVSAEPVDLAGWKLGDLLGSATISSGSLWLDSGQYIVLVQDSLDFVAFYTEFDSLLRRPSSWRELNDGGDVITLTDSFGLEADRHTYSSAFDDNYTWCRGESEERRDDWGKSTESGGTPGCKNEVRFSEEGHNSLEVSIEPRIFSPDGDGRDDSTIISVQAPEASAFTLRIYDSNGRQVVEFEDDSPYLSEQYVWYGRCGIGRSGERLPIGLYILYFEASGVESIKKTLVIAR